MPVPHLHPRLLVSALDYVAIAVGSLGGALHAREHRRYRYDVIGVFGLALVSALGGGVARDVLLGEGPPLALTNVRYLVVALAAAFVALVAGKSIGVRTQQVMLYIDAVSIALFAVAGTTRAASFGLEWLPALMLGVTTAVGGGSLRDVLSGSTPKVFVGGNFYAIAALAAAGAYLVLLRLGLVEGWAVGLAVVLGFSLRVLSVHYGWATQAVRQP